MKTRSVLLFCFFLIAGIVLGGLLAMLTKNISWLSWLSYGDGLNLGAFADKPMVIDLSIIKIVFGLGIKINVGQIIGVIVALILNRKFA
jgi:hypothetical protein